MRIMPSWKQWKKYTKPSKASILSLLLTMLALAIAVCQFLSTPGDNSVTQLSGGHQSQNVNDVSGDVTIEIGSPTAGDQAQPAEDK